MTSDREDDALRWEGESDPSLVPGSAPKTAPPPDAAVTSTATSSFELVAMGVLAGIYLLYIIGWFIGVARIGNPLSDEPLGQFMFSLGGWLAVAAPVIWFGTAYLLTAARPRVRFIWLLLGVLVLAPLPFIFGVRGIS